MKIVQIDSCEAKLKAQFEKVFEMRVRNEDAIYNYHEEIQREYFKTGSIFYVKYNINYTLKGEEHTTDQIIVFFHKNGELAYCLFYDEMDVEEYHKFDRDGDKTIEAIRG